MTDGMSNLVEAIERAILREGDYDVLVERFYQLQAFAAELTRLKDLAGAKAEQMAKTPMQVGRVRLVRAS